MAGPGIKEGEKGSPIIFLEEALKYKDMKIKAVFIDVNSKNISDLRKNTSTFNNRNISITTECGYLEDILPEYFNSDKYKRYGLIYSDANGLTNFDILFEMSRVACYSKTDILINVNCTQIKRSRKLGKGGKKYNTERRSLLDYLEDKGFDKRFISIREPYGKCQWSFILGTNWNSYPDFKNLKLYDFLSEKGWDIVCKLNYTKEEMEED